MPHYCVHHSCQQKRSLTLPLWSLDVSFMSTNVVIGFTSLITVHIIYVQKQFIDFISLITVHHSYMSTKLVVEVTTRSLCALGDFTTLITAHAYIDEHGESPQWSFICHLMSLTSADIVITVHDSCHQHSAHSGWCVQIWHWPQNSYYTFCTFSDKLAWVPLALSRSTYITLYCA